MPDHNFPLPPYGLEKAIRHGMAIERLTRELDEGKGEFAHHDLKSALAFDAADYIWAALMMRHPTAQQSREIRNAVAQAILGSLEPWDHIFEETERG